MFKKSELLLRGRGRKIKGDEYLDEKRKKDEGDSVSCLILKLVYIVLPFGGRERGMGQEWVASSELSRRVIHSGWKKRKRGGGGSGFGGE